MRVVAAQAEPCATQPSATALLRLACLAASCSMLRSRNCWMAQAMPEMSAIWSGAWGVGHGVLVQPLTNKMTPDQNTSKLSYPNANAPNVGYEVFSPCVSAAK